MIDGKCWLSTRNGNYGWVDCGALANGTFQGRIPGRGLPAATATARGTPHK